MAPNRDKIARMIQCHLECTDITKALIFLYKVHLLLFLTLIYIISDLSINYVDIENISLFIPTLCRTSLRAL